VEKHGQDIRFLSCGVIRTGAKNDLAARLTKIYNDLFQVVDQFKPDSAALEEVFVSINPRTALVLGHARAAAILAATKGGLSIHHYPTRVVKQSVAGYGQADKAQVQHMVRVLLRLTSTPSQDASDALAIALCHASHMRILEAMGQ